MKLRRRAGFVIAAVLLATVAPLSIHAGAAPAGQTQWSKTVEAASKEGQVNVYMYAAWANAIEEANAFQKAFPNIRLLLVTGGPSQLAQRVMVERRANKYLVDVLNVGFSASRTLYEQKMLDHIKSALILPEVLDESKWWQGKHHYLDPEKQYAFRYVGAPQYGSISFNTKLAKQAEFKSLWDFVHPKWKGKIIVRDVTRTGPGSGAMRFFYYHSKIGPEFIKRLFGEMDITVFRDIRQGIDWLANGKYAICFFCGSEIYKAASQGLPLDTIGPMKEGAGLVSSYGGLVTPKSPPHPNATKVFVNWYLSREGQITLQKALSGGQEESPDSLRIDIPKDDIPTDSRRRDGVEYMDLDSREEWMQRDGYLNLVRSMISKGAKP